MTTLLLLAVLSTFEGSDGPGAAESGSVRSSSSVGSSTVRDEQPPATELKTGRGVCLCVYSRVYFVKFPLTL